MHASSKETCSKKFVARDLCGIHCQSLREASEMYGVALGMLSRCALECGWPAEVSRK